MNTFLFSFFFFLPAGVANIVPVVVAKMPILREYCYPLDFGKRFHGRRILGDHKTIRGLLAGIFAGILTVMIEKQFGFTVTTHPIFLGFLLSFGTLLGDSVKSFFKRQVGVASGTSWFPFDQIDYIVGGLVLSLLIVQLSIIDYLVIFLLYFFLHLATSALGFLLTFKETPI